MAVVNSVGSNTGALSKVEGPATEKKNGSSAFDDVMQGVQSIKDKGASYEKAVTSNQTAGDDDWVMALASLKADLDVMKRLMEEFVGAAQKISNTQVN